MHFRTFAASPVLILVLSCTPQANETTARVEDEEPVADDDVDAKAGQTGRDEDGAAGKASSPASDDDAPGDDDDDADAQGDDDDTSSPMADDDTEMTDSESDDDVTSTAGQSATGDDDMDVEVAGAGSTDVDADDDDTSGDDASDDDTSSPPQPTGEPCPSYAIFCDDFEDGNGVDTTKWDIWDYWAELAGQQRNAQSQQFQIDSTTAAHGSRSLHLLWGGAFGTDLPTTIQNKVGLPAPDDELYVRMYMRFASLVIPGAHPYFLTALGPEDQWEPYGAQVAFGSIWNGFATNAFSRGIDYGLPWLAAADTISENEWFCVQIHAFGDHQGAGDTEHPNEVFEVSIKGMAIPELAGTDASWPADGQPEYWSPSYDGSFWRLGFGSAPSNEEAMEYWVDALAFAQEPIPCLE